MPMKNHVSAGLGRDPQITLRTLSVSRIKVRMMLDTALGEDELIPVGLVARALEFSYGFSL